MQILGRRQINTCPTGSPYRIAFDENDLFCELRHVMGEVKPELGVLHRDRKEKTQRINIL